MDALHYLVSAGLAVTSIAGTGFFFFLGGAAGFAFFCYVEDRIK